MKHQALLHDAAELPPAYRVQRTVDLKKDRRLNVTIQGVFALVAFSAVASALLLDLSLSSSLAPIVVIPVILFGCLAYMTVHEATHGVALQLLTRARPTYGFRFPFLTTGSSLFLTKRSAVIVALAPSVIWGVVLLGALLTVPADFRLVAYVLLALNFAGSAGDYVEAFVVAQQQPNALVQDEGDEIRIFARRNQE